MRILPFIIIAAVFAAVNYYIFLRLWQAMPGTIVGRGLLLGAAAALAVSLAVFMLYASGINAPSAVMAPTYNLLTTWMMLMLFVLMFFLAVDLLKLTHVVPRGFMRESWFAFGGVAAGVVLLAAVGNIVYHNKKRVEITIDTPKPHEPLRIVAVTDLHLGYTIGPKELARWVATINAEKPDVVLMVGDVCDNSPQPLIEKGFAEVLKGLESRYGVFAVPGNHEYIGGIEGCLDFLSSAGMTVLRDSSATMGGVHIVGRDDRTNTARKSLDELLAPLDRSHPVIVLDHQPYELDSVAAAGVELQISGHTHRGQIWPISWITDAMFESSHGLTRKGDTNIFVSSGLGIWGGKFRLGTRSEYVVVEM